MGQNLVPLDQVGAPFRSLRAFRKLLFMETLALAPGPATLPDLPPAVVAQHLFSRAPPALVSPHVRSNLTPAQVSPWHPSRALARDGGMLSHGLRGCCAVGIMLPPSNNWASALTPPPLPPVTNTLHTYTHLPPLQYSLWLDEHSQEEALKFVRNALDAGVAKAKGDADVAAIQPIIKEWVGGR